MGTDELGVIGENFWGWGTGICVPLIIIFADNAPSNWPTEYIRICHDPIFKKNSGTFSGEWAQISFTNRSQVRFFIYNFGSFRGGRGATT